MRHASRSLGPTICACIALAACSHRPCPPAVTVAVPTVAPLPPSAREACDLSAADAGSDPATLGGYLAMVERALARCRAEVAARS